VNPLIVLNVALVLLYGDYLLHCFSVWQRIRSGKPLPRRPTALELAFRSFLVAGQVFILVITPFFRTLVPGSPTVIVATLYGIAMVGGLYLAISWRWPVS